MVCRSCNQPVVTATPAVIRPQSLATPVLIFGMNVMFLGAGVLIGYLAMQKISSK